MNKNTPPMSFEKKERLVFLAWAFGFVLAGTLCWVLTWQVRSAGLVNAANASFARSGNSIRLGRPLGSRETPRGAGRMGFWFAVAAPARDVLDGKTALVFTLTAGGGFIPCAAVVDSGGKVETLFPLGGNREPFERLPPGAFWPYIRRIEAGFVREHGGKR